MNSAGEIFKKRMLSVSQQTQQNFKLGAAGEQRAVQYLIHKNYQILERNIRLKNCEVDIIALDTRSNELVFVEVKTRTTAYFGDPSQAVSSKKIRSMQLVAREYMRQQHWVGEFRFDVVAVLPDTIEHFENVTWF
jgi:putative endonuclease